MLPYTYKGYRNKINKLESYLQKKIPNFQIKSKESSLLFKILSKLLFFNKDFKNYTVTLYPIVWFPKQKRINNIKTPSSMDCINYLEILSHEGQHLLDRKKLWWFFNLFYISPQIFALGILGSFWSLWFLLFLLFLGPIPSIGRTILEMRGYKISIASYYWLTGKEKDINWITSQFTTGAYYWMWPFKRFIKSRLEKFSDDVWRNKNIKSTYLKDLKRILTSQ